MERQFHPRLELLTPFLGPDFRALNGVGKCKNREHANGAKAHFSRSRLSVQIFTLGPWGGGALLVEIMVPIGVGG